MPIIEQNVNFVKHQYIVRFSGVRAAPLCALSQSEAAPSLFLAKGSLRPVVSMAKLLRFGEAIG